MRPGPTWSSKAVGDQGPHLDFEIALGFLFALKIFFFLSNFNTQSGAQTHNPKKHTFHRLEPPRRLKCPHL